MLEGNSAEGEKSIDIYDNIDGVQGMEVEQTINMDNGSIDVEHFQLGQSELNNTEHSACPPVNSILTNLIQLGSSLIEEKTFGSVLQNSARSGVTDPGIKEMFKANKHGVTLGCPKSPSGTPRFLEGEERSVDLDLYEDIIGNAHQRKQTTLSEVEKQLKASQEETNSLRLKLQALTDQHNRLVKDYDTLKKNCSVLYETARLEVGRKTDRITQLTNRLHKIELYVIRRHGGYLPAELEDDFDYASSASSQSTNNQKNLPTKCAAPDRRSPATRSPSPSCTEEDRRNKSSVNDNNSNDEYSSKHSVKEKSKKGRTEFASKKPVDSNVNDPRHKSYERKGRESSKISSSRNRKGDKEILENVEKKNKSKIEVCEEEQLSVYLNFAKRQERLYNSKSESRKSRKHSESKNQLKGSNETHTTSAVNEPVVEKDRIGQMSPCEDTDDDKLIIDILNDNSNSLDKALPGIDSDGKKNASDCGQSFPENNSVGSTIVSSISVESPIEKNHANSDKDQNQNVENILLGSQEEISKKSTDVNDRCSKHVSPTVKDKENDVLTVIKNQQLTEIDQISVLKNSEESVQRRTTEEKSQRKHQKRRKDSDRDLGIDHTEKPKKSADLHESLGSVIHDSKKKTEASREHKKSSKSDKGDSVKKESKRDRDGGKRKSNSVEISDKHGRDGGKRKSDPVEISDKHDRDGGKRKSDSVEISDKHDRDGRNRKSDSVEISDKHDRDGGKRKSDFVEISDKHDRDGEKRKSNPVKINDNSPVRSEKGKVNKILEVSIDSDKGSKLHESEDYMNLEGKDGGFVQVSNNTSKNESKKSKEHKTKGEKQDACKSTSKTSAVHKTLPSEASLKNTTSKEVRKESSLPNDGKKELPKEHRKSRRKKKKVPTATLR